MSEFSITKSGVLKSYNGDASDIVIPDGVKKIGSMAFFMNSGITSVTIPGCVTEIGESAFGNCNVLEKVVFLSGKPVSICDNAFGDCKKLTIVELPEKIKSISDTAFKGCEGLADEQGNIIIRGTLCSHIGTNAEVIIEDGVHSIAADAFKWCESIERIVIPDSVTTIGSYAFCGCSNLKEMTLPDSVCNIGEFAFANCPKLSDDNGFLIFRNSLFAYNGSASDVVIPTGIKKIEPWAFNCCQSVVSITIPDSVAEIGKNAFYQCGQLTKVTLPEGLQKLATSVFGGCISLSEVIIPKTVTEIMARAFYDCEAITKLTIPEAVTLIGENAFMSCKKITQITLPEGLTDLGDGAFKLCDSLKTIFIPKGVKSIGFNTFSRCGSLEVIEAPEHLHNDIDNCYLRIEVKYYEENGTSEQENIEPESESDDSTMSTIEFCCTEEQKPSLKSGIHEIIENHYFKSVHPNTKAEYEDEGEAVYRERLKKLVSEKLCVFEDTEDGLSVEFDSTEDAGFFIADEVYHTSMGYSDNGLTYIDPIFVAIVKTFPDICFEADTECSDKWIDEENHYSYDGAMLTKDDEEIDYDDSSTDDGEEGNLTGEQRDEIYHGMAEQILSADTDYADDLRQKLKEAEHNYDNDSPFDHPLYHLVGYLINVVGTDFSTIEDMLRNLGASEIETSYIIEDSFPFYDTKE